MQNYVLEWLWYTFGLGIFFKILRRLWQVINVKNGYQGAALCIFSIFYDDFLVPT